MVNRAYAEKQLKEKLVDMKTINNNDVLSIKRMDWKSKNFLLMINSICIGTIEFNPRNNTYEDFKPKQIYKQKIYRPKIKHKPKPFYRQPQQMTIGNFCSQDILKLVK